MINISHIFRGWFASKIHKTVSAAELSSERLSECEICPFTYSSKILIFINRDAKEIETLACRGCGCPVVEKSLVKEEKCPKDKWKR